MLSSTFSPTWNESNDEQKNTLKFMLSFSDDFSSGDNFKDPQYAPALKKRRMGEGMRFIVIIVQFRIVN